MRYLLSILFVLQAWSLFAQDFHKRYTFAKLFMGLDVNFIPNSTSLYLDGNQELKEFTRNSALRPAFNIGATHFWGYTDIYVSISLPGIKFKEDLLENQSDFGVFTGFRVYPWPTEDGKVRPFLGYKFSPYYYWQEDRNGQSASHTDVKSVLDLGLTYRSSRFYLYLAYNQYFSSKIRFPLSRDYMSDLGIPASFLNLGINYMIETSYLTNNKVNKHFHEVFKDSNRKGWYLALGPSSAFPIGRSSYISDLYPFLDQRNMPTVFPDMSVGYHFTKSNWVTGLAYRRYKQGRSAYNYSQVIRRRSLGLEAYRLMGDYHGFVPYLGLGLGYEDMNLRERDRNLSDIITDVDQEKLSPYLVFGWDIRPGRKGDFWVLRTNLRYSPFLSLDHKGKQLSLQHLEFNFIQFVIYPQRLKAYRNY